MTFLYILQILSNATIGSLLTTHLIVQKKEKNGVKEWSVLIATDTEVTIYWDCRQSNSS